MQLKFFSFSKFAPSSKSPASLFFGKPPIGLPSGVTTYLSFSIKKVIVPIIIAIEAAKNAHKVVVGSFLNINALCEWLVSEKKNILLLCSGWKNKFNLEDALFAGAATELLTQLSDEFKLGDACLALKFLYQQAEQDPIKFLAHASHKERLARLNLKKDIKYCLTPNQTQVIPILKDGALVKLMKENVVMAKFEV